MRRTPLVFGMVEGVIVTLFGQSEAGSTDVIEGGGVTKLSSSCHSALLRSKVGVH